ncbi:hypothetical protein GF373_16355 [bacterium]|nr:hypothetical protein [bacterium]
MLFSSKRPLLKKIRIKKPTVFCMPGFYVDIIGPHIQAESVENYLPLLREYLVSCRADPYYGVYVSDIDLLKPYLDLYPEERAWIMRLIQQERCSTGGAYNQPNETSIGGEALIRNLLIGQTYHRTMLDSISPVYMNWNAYGHIPQMPQILYQCGISAALFSHGDVYNATAPIPGISGLFLWTAPNGSWVYARRMNHQLLNEFNREAIESHLTKESQEQYAASHVDLLLDAGQMQRPRVKLIGFCRDSTTSEPAVFFTGAAAAKYIAAVEPLFQKDKLALEPVTRDMTQCCIGGELTRNELKTANRLAENRIFEAELWGTICMRYDIPYPSYPLDKAWRQLLFGQHHNAITGFGNEIAYVDLLEGYREALETAERERHRTTKALASLIHTQTETNESAAVIFNSLPWARDGIARAWIEPEDDVLPLKLTGSSNQPIPFEIEQIQYNEDETISKAQVVWLQKDLPAAGYETVSFKKKDNFEVPYLVESLSQTWVENEFYRIDVDPDRGGGIVSIYDKENDKEFVNTHHVQPANDVMALAQDMDEFPQAHLLTAKDRLLGSDYRAEVKYLEGAVSNRLVIRGKGPGPCTRIQEIRLYRETRYIDCYTILEDYQGYGRKKSRKAMESVRDFYALAFPLALPGSLPVLEDKFYAKANRRGRRNLDFYGTHQENGIQHGMNSCYRWMDVSWTFLVRFMDGQTVQTSLAVGPSEIVLAEEEHRDILERLTIFLAQHGVTCTPRRDRDDPKTDLLQRQVSFSLGTPEQNAYTKQLLKTNPQANDFYRQSMDEFGYAVLAVPDRFSDPSGEARPAFIFAGRTAELTMSAIDEMVQSTTMHRWDCPQAICFMENLGRVEDVGFALLNRGNTSCSLEADGTLALALMHTVPYVNPQTAWPFDFAEGKSNIFQYRLLPHAGDWRHAEIPRRAMEYNHEPFTVHEPSHEGPLPTKHSFFSVDPRNILISAMKPAGFAEAEFRKPERYSNAFTIRFYEAHGDQSNIWLETQNGVKSVKPVTLAEKPLPMKREVYREEQFIRTVVQAFELFTLNMEIKPESKIVYQPPEKPKRPVKIAPSRYWRYNSGAAPDGFLPLSLSLRGGARIEPDSIDSIYHLDLVLVNNSPVENRNGEVEILTPPYWRVIPNRLSYRIQEGSYQIIPVHLLVEEHGREGFIKARTRVNDIMVEDLIHIGKPPEFDLAMTLTGDGLNVKLSHKYPYELSGSLSLITPLETWPPRLVGELSISSVDPCKQAFTIPPEGTILLSFPLTEQTNYYPIPSEHFWMIIKLAAHNTIRYYHVRLDGKPSEGLGQLYHPPYKALPDLGL